MLLLLITSSLLPEICPAQDRPYRISFPALADSLKARSKPVIVQVGTSWCVYCRLQSRQIEKSRALKQLLKDNFYFLVLDAESREGILFNHHYYRFAATGNGTGTHELALQLARPLKGRTGYPMWILLTPDLDFIDGYSGYLSSKDLIYICNQKVNAENFKK